MVQQAIGAIENALDIKAKALGVPVYELFGGPVRERIRLYWSHCGTYRLSWSEPMQIPPLRTLDDVVAAGGGGRQRLYGAQDQRLSARGPSAPARARLRPRRLLPRAQCRAQRDRRDPRSARGLSRGRRPGRRHPGRPQLQLQNRGLPEDGARHGTLRSVLGRNRHAQSQGASPHPAGHHHSRRIRRVCSAGATTDRTSSSRRWTWRSSTRRGTGSPSP